MKKSKTAKLYHQNGEVTLISPSNGKDFKLKELQDLVGGMIETIYLDDKMMLIVNEEGKFKVNCEYNEHATCVAKTFNAIFPTDYICGDAVMCEHDMVK